MEFEKFYDESEFVNARFVGFSLKDSRYDFGLIYTNLFFGKPLVVCMQTGRATLLDPRDIEDLTHLKKTFHIKSFEETFELAQFLKETIPNTPFEEQYE